MTESFLKLLKLYFLNDTGKNPNYVSIMFQHRRIPPFGVVG